MGQCYEKNESNEVIIREIGPVIRTGYTVILTFFTAQQGPSFITLFIQYLPPLSQHCGEVPGRDSNPGRVVQRLGG